MRTNGTGSLFGESQLIHMWSDPTLDIQSSPRVRPHKMALESSIGGIKLPGSPRCIIIYSVTCFWVPSCG